MSAIEDEPLVGARRDPTLLSALRYLHVILSLSHAQMGHFGDVNEFTEPIGPEHRALDALQMKVRDWYDAARGGVTTIVTGPGSGERMGGQSITIKMC